MRFTLAAALQSVTRHPWPTSPTAASKFAATECLKCLLFTWLTMLAGAAAGATRRCRDVCHAVSDVCHESAAAAAAGGASYQAHHVDYVAMRFTCTYTRISQSIAFILPIFSRELSSQNVVMVIATSSVDMLHVARQRQWNTCVTGTPTAGVNLSQYAPRALGSA